MSTETIQNAQYRVIGYIETRSDGTKVAKDSTYRIVGYYDPKNGQTKDSTYRVVGHGDLLSSLITSAGR